MHIDGLMFAIAAAPEIPMPATWLPWIVKTSGNIEAKDADELTSLLLALLKHRLSEMQDETFLLPKDCQFHATQSNLPLKQWLTGLMVGHQQLEPVWLEAWQCVQQQEPQVLTKLKRDLSHCLLMFSTFAEPELAIEQAKQKGNNELVEKLPVIFQSFPKALKQYVDISGSLVSYIPNQFEMYDKPLKS